MTDALVAALDLGNTRTKACVFGGGSNQPQHVAHWPTAEAEAGVAAWLQKQRPVHLAWCSVAAEHTAGQHAIETYQVGLQHRLTPDSCGLRLSYATPQTLGADRLAAVWGGRAAATSGHVLTVDAGTAITYDVLLANGTYLGGAISAGAGLRLQALHQHTARLPLPPAEALAQGRSLVGADTQGSLLAGAHWGTAAEVQQYVSWLCQWLTQHYPGPEAQVFLTGGDGAWLYPLLNPAIFSFLPHLVLQGLYHWLTTKAKQ